MVRGGPELAPLKLVLSLAFDVGHDHGQHLFVNVNSSYSVSHYASSWRERKACRNLHQPGSRAMAAPQREETTPNYSLNHARSGSDKPSASTYPLLVRPRRSNLLPYYF